MGKSLFFKIVSVVVIVLGSALAVINFFMKPIEIKDTNQSIALVPKIDKNITKDVNISYDKNKTLDRKYKSVALEIEEFIKKQKLTQKETLKPILKDINISETIQKKSDKKIDIISYDLPKLAIIMDDVGFSEQAQSIKKIPFAITPSIFPQNEHYPDTQQIAKMFKYYMVHFPMEAYDYKNIKEEALKTTDSLKIIEKRVQNIKQYFPSAIAINNHTGSKFTCDFDAMDRFFSVLTKYNIEFIDSRTASETKCLEAGKIYDRKVLQRDIFLDNIEDIEYIENQLKEAVEIAKRNGKAIAICHPKDLTFEVLMNSKDILKDVDLVYINELM